jgi:hypothetical protein
MSQQVFVALLDEGTSVWRPVNSRNAGGNNFEILGTMPNDETWQFAPGAIVRCEPHLFADGTVGLVAVESMR